jgi:hypothetical protein
MFHRIIVEEWQRVLTITSFTIFFSVFIINLIRVWRMPNGDIERLGNLPLQSEPNDSHE